MSTAARQRTQRAAATEQARLDALDLHEVLGTPSEGAFDEIVDLARLQLQDARSDRATAHAEVTRPPRVEAQPILDAMLDAAVGIDDAGIVLSFNTAAEQMFGRSAQDVIGQNMADLLIPARLRERHRLGLKRLVEGGSSPILGKRVEVRGLRSDGEEFPAELTVALVEGPPTRWMAFVRDLDESKARERELEELAQDNATLLDSIGDGIFRIDLEGLVTFVNPAAREILGWEADGMLGKHAHELLHHSHENGTHYPVEECPNYAALRGEVHHVTTEVFWRRDGTSFPVDYTGAPIRVGGEIVGSVCCFADITEARQRERDLEERVRWSERIHLAVREERFVLLGQPIYPCSDLARPVRHELLIRMKDSDRKDSLVSPGEFLPEVERLGLIGQIDRWVISKAILEAKHRPVSMNLSARSISDSEISDLIIRGLQQERVPRKNFMLEITETAALEDLEAAYRFVQRLTDIGCQIALDDFGTGYGTFAHLKELPVSYLKVDRSFVQQLGVSEGDDRVVRSIVSVAGHFGMKTIAEGVETQAALDTVRKLGADLAQGFLLGRPEPLPESLS